MNRKDELSEFERASGELPDAVRKRLETTEQTISAQLDRSRRRFLVSFLILSIAGYFLSLAVCSQNSVALTGFSLSMAAMIHQLPDPLCPIVCGTVFSAVPFLCLIAFLDRFQRRRMMFTFWWLPVLTAFFSCLLMIFLPESFRHAGMQGNHGAMSEARIDAIWLAWWTVSAVALPLALILIFKFRSRPAMRGF